MNTNFLIIDPNKNILLVPNSNEHIIRAIQSVGIDKVIKNETAGEMLAKIKRYLKNEDLDVPTENE